MMSKFSKKIQEVLSEISAEAEVLDSRQQDLEKARAAAKTAVKRLAARKANRESRAAALETVVAQPVRLIARILTREFLGLILQKFLLILIVVGTSSSLAWIITKNSGLDEWWIGYAHVVPIMVTAIAFEIGIAHAYAKHQLLILQRFVVPALGVTLMLAVFLLTYHYINEPEKSVLPSTQDFVASLENSNEGETIETEQPGPLIPKMWLYVCLWMADLLSAYVLIDRLRQFVRFFYEPNETKENDLDALNNEIKQLDEEIAAYKEEITTLNEDLEGIERERRDLDYFAANLFKNLTNHNQG